MNSVDFMDVVVSKGFEGKPAVFISESGKLASFTVGDRVYDKDEDSKHRYVNYKVEARGYLAERVSKMDLKEGAYIHIKGRLDEETWEDKDTKKTRRKPVIIAEDIAYALAHIVKNGDGQNGQNGGGQNGYGNGGQNGYNNGGYGAQSGYGGPGPGGMPPQQNGQMQQQYQQGGMPNQQQSMPQQGQMPQNFTGYENYGQNGNGGNPYFNNQG